MSNTNYQYVEWLEWLMFIKVFPAYERTALLLPLKCPYVRKFHCNK